MLSLAAAAVGFFGYRARILQVIPAAGLRIAAAADLQAVIPELRTAFGQDHPGIPVEVSFGSSGSLFAQLKNGAPFDVFMSADADYPRKLCEAGVARTENTFRYAVGHVVVWAPRESSLPLEQEGIRALLAPGVRKVALANPEFAPYGRAARAALEKFGVYEQLREKLVFGDNVAQTAQFAQTGTADAALLSLSLALSPILREQGRHWEVPADAYPKLEQVGVVMNDSKDPSAAQVWRAFMVSPKAQAILRMQGFSIEK